MVHGAIDIDSNPSGVERMKNGNLRIYEKLNYYPPVGALLSSKVIVNMIVMLRRLILKSVRIFVWIV